MRFSILILLICSISLSAQNYAKDWHLQYSEKDTNYGIGLHKAILNNPAPAGAKTVIVAVIDGGTDVNHPDLKNNIWVNPGEILGNGVDDDHNGYVDDMHGWDFLGSAGADIEFDNLEITRLLRDYKTRFDATTGKLTSQDKKDLKTYKKMYSEYQKQYEEAQKDYKFMQFLNNLSNSLLSELDSSNISLKDLKEFDAKKPDSKYAQEIIIGECTRTGNSPKSVFDEIREGFEHTAERINYHLNFDFDSRPTIGDNYRDATTNNYGNSEVVGPDAFHGTHVAGIIGATRNNSLGMDGIAPLVKIMVLRVVPNGDERDKDVAHAIRYAADNGAKIINMSFGKYYSYNAAVVKEAIRYAESKDVLFIHAAGNDNKDNDKTEHYPVGIYDNDSVCKTWIEVGASDRDQNPASFSNYGKKTVHVFAPGVDIYSTIGNGLYKASSGTSMAAPVVAGLAALIRAYYPNLTAIQVKQIIESSVVKPVQKVKKPGKKKKKTKYKKLCSTAGIVNAEQALKAAAAVR